jgi:hypothetical protein
MRKAIILLPVLMLGGCHAAFGEESHERAARSFQVGGFDKIALAGSGDVEVRTGAAPSVRVEGDKEAIDRLDIRVENGELRIGRRREGDGWHFGFVRERHLKIFVTVPNVTAASITGSGDLRIDKVAGNRFDGSISGSGDLGIAQMEVAETSLSIAGSGDILAAGKAGKAAETSLSIAGSGDILAAGKAGKASLSTAGSGEIRAGGLETGSVNVSVMGSGDVQVRASQSADVNIMGSGDVHVAGTSNCKVHKAGSGDAQCG